MIRERSVIFSIFGNPYILDYFPATENADVLIMAYQPTPSAVKSVFKSIFGELYFEGRLPVSTQRFKVLSGEVNKP